MASSTIEVKVVGDSTSAVRALKSAGSAADGLGSKASGKLVGGLKLAGIAALGLAGVVGGGLAVALKTGFGELREAESVLATSSTLIKNLGSNTKITTGDIEKWASSLQGMTGIPDDVIMSAENTLLKFDALAGDSGVFQRTTALAADMSVALGKDMPAAATALGRALADPEAAMGKLARMGIVLTEQQQKVIDKFVETGDTAGATEYLLGLLEAKFGGVAEAAGDTTAGKIEILKRKFEDISEALAGKLMPYADRFIDWVTTLADSGSASEALGTLASGFSSLGQEILKAIGSGIDKIDWGQVFEKIGARIAKSQAMWIPIAEGAAKALWSALGAAFSAGADLGAKIGEPIGRKLGEWIAKGLMGALDLVVPAADALMGGIQAIFEGLGKIPGTPFAEWAEDIGDAREGLDHWHKELGPGIGTLREYGQALGKNVSFIGDLIAANGTVTGALVKTGAAFKTLQDLVDRGGMKNLAAFFAAATPKIDAAQVATLAFVQATGKVPTKVQVEALFNDPAARAAIEAYTAKIENIPATSETRAELMAQAAIELADQLAGKIKAIPDSSTTTVSTPGADAAAGDADRVADKVRGIPDSSRTHIHTTGAENAVAAADRVADHIRNIPTSWGTTITVTTVGGDLPVGTAGGLAGGTRSWRGGWTMVGEEGPELVNLPRGADVYTAADTRRMTDGPGASPVAMGGGGGDIIVNVHVAGHVMSDNDLATKIRDILGRRGQAMTQIGLR